MYRFGVHRIVTTMKTKRYKYSKLMRAILIFIGYRYNEIITKEDRVHVFLKRTRKMGICPRCKRRCHLTNKSHKRTIRDLDLGPLRSYITFFKHRIKCKCGFTGYEYTEFNRHRSRCTVRFEKFVYLLCQKMTITDVSEIAGMNWKSVKAIDKYYIKEQIGNLRDINPKRIGVDEIAYRKGHNYLTVVRDFDLNAVIWIGLNRRKETLDEFFRLIRKEKCREISIVVTDMHDPYIASIKEYCSQADLVFDKFHVIKKINEALDEIRKKEFADADENEKKNMKKKRFVILKRRKKLNERQEEDLYTLVANNDTLFQAYLLKEQVSDIFDELSLEDAWGRMNIWARNVMHSNLEPFEKVIKTMKRYSYGIYNYFKHQLTNAQSEGFNTKINIIRRKAYGFWDLEYFMLKIHQACGVMKLD